MMVTYADGTVARIGDYVDLDGTPVVVVDVIDSDEARARWGWQEDGLMFECDKYGLVCEAADSIQSDPTIIFLKRAD